MLFAAKLFFSSVSLFHVIFSCDRCALVKVKGSVFIVAVVGSSAAAYEVRISTGCA